MLNRWLFPTVALIFLMGCSSDTVTVDWEQDIPIGEEDIHLLQDLDTGNGGDKDIVPDEQGVEDILYADEVVLEYFEPYGDDNKKCQGYAGSGDPDVDQKIDNCYFEMSYNQVRAFKVVYFEDGHPTPSREIEWVLMDAKDPDTEQPIAEIDTLSSGTNFEGVASVNVTTHDLLGDFVLKATAVSQMYTVKPLFFNIRIMPKAVEPLTVKLKHEGAAIFDTINVYLFSQNGGEPSCAKIDPESPPFPAAKSQAVASVTQSVKFPFFSDLSAENPLMFTICAIATKGNGPPLAYGCNDIDGLVEYGKSKAVTVVLHDVPPKYAGTYEVVNHFDMLSALPDEVEEVVNIIIDFFNSPAAGLMELTCILGLDDLCDTFFNDPNNPDIEDLSAIGSIAASVINSVLYALLADNVGSDILFTGKDVGNILRDLEIYSTVKIKDEPDSTGFISSDKTSEEWHTVAFQWTLGQNCNPTDPSCGLQSYSFNAIGQDVVIASFDAQIPGYVLGDFDDLIIEPHSLNFKYGAFLNFVIEKLVLPELAGNGEDGSPPVDSYEKFFGSLLGGGPECLLYNDCCANFAAEIVTQSGLSWLQSVLQSGCDVLIPLGAEYLRNFLIGLDADTGDTFTIGTPDNLPCTLYDIHGNHEIDKMGQENPNELRCHWDVLLKLGSANVLFDAEWWGIRQQ